MKKRSLNKSLVSPNPLNALSKAVCAAATCALSLGFLGGGEALALSLTGGGTGTTNGGLARFTTVSPPGLPPAGSGVINSFLRVQKNNSETGFNTDFRSNGQPPLDGVAGNFTRNLLLSAVPTTNDGFRRFILDLNEPDGGNGPLIDLTALKLYLSPTASLSSLNSLTPIFSLAETVNLKDVNSGSGKYDILVDIANSLFTGPSTQYLYLYSAFSGTAGGFEEWSVGTPTTPVIPTPAAVLPALFGMGMAAVRRKKDEAAQDA